MPSYPTTRKSQNDVTPMAGMSQSDVSMAWNAPTSNGDVVSARTAVVERLGLADVHTKLGCTGYAAGARAGLARTGGVHE